MPGEGDSIRGFGEGDDGALLIGTSSGIRRLVDGKTEAYPLQGASGKFRTEKLLRDREGGLWIGTSNRGLVHVHKGRTDVFAQPDGLSGDHVVALLEDREGNIWVVTTGGLDRFRDLAVATLSVSQGLSNATVGSVLAARDGSVWLGTSDGLNRWNNGQITVYRRRGDRSAQGAPPRAAQQPAVREINGGGLPDKSVGSLFQDDRGRIWVSTLRGVAYFEDGQFVPAGSVPSRIVHSITEESAGNLWINDQEQGLFHLLDGRVVERIPWAKLGPQDHARALVPDRVLGGLWLGFRGSGVAYLKDGQVRASYGAADGLGEGIVTSLRFDPDGTLWAATEGGLSRLKNGRIATLTSKNGLPCDAVNGVQEDDDHSLWLYMACSLVRISRSELDAWVAAVDKAGAKESVTEPRPSGSGQTIHPTVFDSSDGVRSAALSGGYSPQVAKSADGKLWFAGLDGVSVVDPRHLPFNNLPPPVHIEQIIADRKPYDANGALRLPPLIRDLEIDYTALSFVAPEKMRFRYKLEGRDSDWQDVGTRRQAYYNDLSPRNYRFRVAASNNSGVWNEAGASFDFSIAPAYYQTTWFRLSAVTAILAMLAGLYQLRLRQVARQFSMRMVERVNERTRIARELHDTLLQDLAGVSLQLDGIAKQAALAPEKTVSLIGRVREQVDYCFREARTKVWNLRSPSLEDQGLAAALRDFVERIGPATTARCGFTLTGKPFPCPLEVEEELLRIAQEAANNANRHAQANQIRVALAYGHSSLALTISDDGRGFDFEEGFRKTGHWGLKNMQERSAEIRGKCKITTAVGRGTQVEIRVPLSSWSLRNTRAKHAHTSSGS
jgi:signal transduction histidine kinase/sugar lactone lactonase YvrE